MISRSEVVEQVEMTLEKKRDNCSKAMIMSDILPEEVKNVVSYVSKRMID